MRHEDGTMGSAGDGAGIPFALLSVPALLAGLSPELTELHPPVLRFSLFSADYHVRDGEAVTPGLHFDGDAEILVRGRVGLSSGDYDQQAWILRGEDGKYAITTEGVDRANEEYKLKQSRKLLTDQT